MTLIDLRLPDVNGIDALITIRSGFPEARIIMLTTFEGDAEIQRSLEAGARGYLLKTMPPKELVEVIRQVHARQKRIPPELAAQLAEHLGDEVLTEREIDVLRHIAGGSRNRNIAEGRIDNDCLRFLTPAAQRTLGSLPGTTMEVFTHATTGVPQKPSIS